MRWGTLRQNRTGGYATILPTSHVLIKSSWNYCRAHSSRSDEQFGDLGATAQLLATCHLLHASLTLHWVCAFHLSAASPGHPSPSQ